MSHVAVQPRRRGPHCTAHEVMIAAVTHSDPQAATNPQTYRFQSPNLLDSSSRVHLSLTCGEAGWGSLGTVTNPWPLGNLQVKNPVTYPTLSLYRLISSSRSCNSPTILLQCLHNQLLPNLHIFRLWGRRCLLLFWNWRSLLPRLYTSLKLPRYALAKT